MRKSTEISTLIDIGGGITAVTGSGGKTSLLSRLAFELPGTVILTTSTHILPFEGIPLYTGDDPEECGRLLKDSRVICVGTPEPSGKLSAPPIPFEHLAALSDHVIVEADGSRRLPLKAHAEYEPVIPDGTSGIINVFGLSGLGLSVFEAVHRPELFLERCSSDPGRISVQMIFDVFSYEYSHGCYSSAIDIPITLFFNQEDALPEKKSASFKKDALRIFTVLDMPDGSGLISGSLLNSRFSSL